MIMGPRGPFLILSMMALLMLLPIHGVDGAASQIQQAYLSGRACHTTADCLAHVEGHWCLSGQVCANQRCYTMPDYPCRRDTFCMEREHKCVPRHACKTEGDCDDGVFCNGEEKCVDGQCQRVARCPSNSVCYEANKTCVAIDNRAAARTQHIYQPPRIVGDAKGGVVGAKTSAPTEAPTASSTVDYTSLWTILFITACVLFGIALVFYIVTGAARPATPSSVIVITQNTDGTDADNANARMLLSRDNYQQKITWR